MPKVYLSNKDSFHIDPNQTIFDAAKKANILFEHSCLNGRCNSCIGKIVEGETQKVRDEIGLTRQELENNFILTCCRTANSDVKLEIEQVSGIPYLPQPKTIPAKIQSLKPIQQDIVELTIRIPPTTKFEFEPGQYVNLSKNGVRRSYSILKMNKTLIKFLIREYPDGKFSNYLFRQARLNDLIQVNGPYGTFCLRKKNSDHLIFMATGTGIAPIICILDALNRKTPPETPPSIHIFQGARFQNEILRIPVFENLTIQTHLCLSRERTDGTETGYVQDVFLKAGIPIESCEFYACGSQAMTRDAKKTLLQHGMNPHQFHSDAFVETNHIQ